MKLLKCIFFSGLAFAASLDLALAVNVSLQASDALGTSSFNSAGNWNSGASPAATNSYFISTYTLRSPANSSAYTFAGGALSIDAGGRFLMKGTGGQIITVTNLLLNGGIADFANANNDNLIETLGGNITLAAATTSYFGALGLTTSIAEALSVTARISGAGSLQIGGPNVNGGADIGTVILAATNLYSGTTTVATGTLLVNGSLANGTVMVSTNAMLGGTGLVSGVISVQRGGKLAPGVPAHGALLSSLGTLTAANTVAMAGTIVMRIDRGASTGSDKLAAPGLSLNAGASLTVVNVGSTNLAPGDVFTLFTTPINGNFTTITLPAMPNSALSWSNRLAIDGTIAVVNTNILGVASANPVFVTTNQSTLLTVGVTPATGPLSTGVVVRANLIPIGGLTAQVFYDDGTHGDVTAGDNVYSFSALVSSNTAPGSVNLGVSVSDAQGRTFATALPLTVILPGGPFVKAPFLSLSEDEAIGSMPLAAKGQAAPIFYSAEDATVVAIAAAALREDVQRVAGLLPDLSTNMPGAVPCAVLIGTIGNSPLIDGLVASGKIDVSAIQGKWESYMARVLTNPVPGVSSALVIVGSDRRGTAFGVFGLSEAMGVSPWYWWGDVPPVQRSSIYVRAGSYTEPSPGVQYRGIFINDEDWGIEPWAAQTFDPVGDIGPATYAKVFELLLRLHANYIWPAMHNSTRAFYTVPGNRQVAHDYAIVIGTSHHEPMLRNTSEYSETTRGAYDYWVNRTNVYKFWEERVMETSTNENIYTVGMRGLSDDGMKAPAGTTDQQKADMLEFSIIPDQRRMLADYVNANPALVPQVFVPYKEALVLYQTGMHLPDDVTLVWPDDNHGYIRQLSSAAERARSGGSGVYYHLSYWGSPANYLWLCTTPPGVVCSEMSKAWHYNARKVWIVNVGDIKPGEIGMEFFLRLARNPEAFSNFDQHAYLCDWATQNFGETYSNAIASILDEFYRLNIVVRPEHLNRTTSGFSFVSNGDEAQRRLDEFATLTSRADALYAELPVNRKAAFYEMVLYPIRGANQLNRKVLLAERSRLWAAQGRAATAALAASAQAADSAIQSESTFYNQTNANGKWNRMMTRTLTGAASAPYLMPAVGSYAAPVAAGLGVAVEGTASVLETNTPGTLPAFNAAARQAYFIDVFNNGQSPLTWTAQCGAPWIILSRTNGNADARIWVEIDWSNAPRGYEVPGTITIQGAGSTYLVKVKLFYPLTLDLASLPAAVENNGVVTIEAEDFTGRQDGANGVGWRRVDHATATGDGMTILPVTAPAIAPAGISSNTPSLTYQFYAFSTGLAAVHAACLPTHKITSDHVGCRYAISLNGESPRVVDINANEYSSAWNVNVLRAAAFGLSNHTITNAGLQTLKIWMIDPGVVLDKLTMSLNPGSLEAENLDLTLSGPYHTFSEGGASGGGAVSLDATGVGQYIVFALPYLPAGVFDLTVRVKAWNNRGTAQMSIANGPGGPFTNVGGPLDFYSASSTYTDLSSVRITNSISGPKFLKFTVTGKNAASSGYLIVVDGFTFTPIQNASAFLLPNWRQSYFGTMDNLGPAADEADPDHDGIPNLIEYATGTYPTVANEFLFAPAFSNNHLRVTFNRANVPDIKTQVMAANSLPRLLSQEEEIWSSTASPYAGGAATALPCTIVDPAEATNDTRFVRLKVTKQ